MANKNLHQSYMDSTRRQFKYYKDLGERTMNQVTDDQLFYEPNRDINSIAIIVKHITGNMLSRWTDFLTSDGEKEWRNRDSEFELEEINTRGALLDKWNTGWQCLFDALDSISEYNFDQLVYIRNMGHTIPDAVNRQLCHYSYHIGQMVYLGKFIKGDNWESLSIPKGQSEAYNNEKFSKPKSKNHFTEDL